MNVFIVYGIGVDFGIGVGIREALNKTKKGMWWHASAVWRSTCVELISSPVTYLPLSKSGRHGYVLVPVGSLEKVVMENCLWVIMVPGDYRVLSVDVACGTCLLF
jgi:hypothetical protein